MSISMFERLQGLPLLMGLSVNELMTIVEEVNFAFDKYYDGDTIVNQGDRCDKIIYVLRGKLCAYRRDDHHQFHIVGQVGECLHCQQDVLPGLDGAHAEDITFARGCALGNGKLRGTALVDE